MCPVKKGVLWAFCLISSLLLALLQKLRRRFPPGKLPVRVVSSSRGRYVRLSYRPFGLMNGTYDSDETNRGDVGLVNHIPMELVLI